MKEQLEEYKKIIVELINEVKEKQELSSSLLKKKNDLLKEIKDSGYDEVEIKRILKELEIPILENELELTVKKEMVKIKKKIENIRISRVARENYKNLQRQAIVLFRGKA